MQDEMRQQYMTVLLMACLSYRAYHDANPFELCDHFIPQDYVVSKPYQVQYSNLFGKDIGYYEVAVNARAATQIIAIQGTDALPDWYTNFSIKPIVDDLLRVPVHSGFRAYAREVGGDLKRRGLLNSSYTTFLTGHSLGGAAALLLGLYWYTATPPEYDVAGVYTFGQPRVFTNPGAASWPAFAHRVYRFENCYDVVPLIPIGDTALGNLFPSLSFLGDREAKNYQHMGQSILLMDGGAYWIPEADLDRPRLADIKSFIIDYKTKQPIDHSMMQYIKRLVPTVQAGKAANPVNPINQFLSVCSPVAPVLSIM